MPLLGRLPLLICTACAALIGERLLAIAPPAGIALLGLALAALLLERWWYPSTLRECWPCLVLTVLVGAAAIHGPLGWFFLAAAAIITGTALRARAIDRRMEQFSREANPHRS